jgi:hypothetical protein
VNDPFPGLTICAGIDLLVTRGVTVAEDTDIGSAVDLAGVARARVTVDPMNFATSSPTAGLASARTAPERNAPKANPKGLVPLRKGLWFFSIHCFCR